MAISALDNQQRPGLMVIQNDQVIVKQLSDFDIQKIRFIDGKDFSQGFITIGKENIRFWKVKSTFDKDHVLTGASVFLGEHARNNQFNDLAICAESSKALVVSSLGNIYIVDLAKKEIVGVYKIHDEACQAIAVDRTSNLIVTTDVEGRVKLWNIDFTDIKLEVKLDSQVNALAVISDKIIVCGCLNGTMGILDRGKKLFNYLVRSHMDEIIQMRYHPVARKVVTISHDFTIRVWEIIGNEQTLFF